LIYVRLLPVAWPIAVMGIAAFGPPGPRDAAAALTVWSIATWTCAASATAALWQQRGIHAFSMDIYHYTVMPAWTLMLMPVVLVAIVFWRGGVSARVRRIACPLTWGLWLAAAVLRAVYDERLYSVRTKQFAQLIDLGNVCGVIAEVIADLVLWQITPLALLLFLARRPPHQVH
jgi:hypothetical protein